MGKRYTVGVLIGNAHTNHPKGLIKGICDSAQGKDVNVLFFLATQSTRFYKELVKDDTDYDYQYNTVYDYALLSEVDVLIIAYGSLCIFQNKKDKGRFLERFAGIPYVLLEDVVENVGLDKQLGVHIIADNYGGMRECLEHLIDQHGFRRIVYVSGPRDNKDSIERLHAYLDTMKARQLPVDESMIAYGNYTEFIDDLLEEVLDAHPDTEAIVCANDEMANGSYRVCKRRNLRVGIDIAVTGFDDIEMSKYAKPSLTTVSQNSQTMGRMALQKAIQLCEGQDVTSARMRVDFIPRESCGCTNMGMRLKLMELKRTADGTAPKDIADTVDELKKFQHKAWLGPFLLRDLMLEADDEQGFYGKVVQILHNMGSKSSYIYTLKKPVLHHDGDDWKCPSRIYMAARQVGDLVESYEKKERPTVSKKNSMIQNMDMGDESHIYTNFLLFEGEKQYGIMTLEIRPEDIALFYMIALQIGTSIRFLEMTQKQNAYRQKLKEKNEVLNFIAIYDELTGVYNRRGIMEELVQFNRLHRGQQAYLVFSDLDHLKEINDTYGHAEGDCAIRTTTGILKNITGKHGSIGRIGGDEFVSIFLADEKHDKDQYVQDIKQQCELYNTNSDKPYYVNISVGMVEFTCSEKVEFKDMLKRADDYLYQAKKVRREDINKAK